MENNEVSKSNKIKIIVITALVFLVSIAGISYAYFTIQITGNETASSMRLRTANMSLVYNDVQIVSGEYAQPGWTDTKTLTVTNNGNVDAYYNIIWRDLINEIIYGELVISATCSSSPSGSCSNMSETAVPTSMSESHNIAVKRGISISPGVTHTYILTALFKETGSNQNYNQNKYFNGTLNIAEGKEPLTMTRNGTDSTTGLPVVRISDGEDINEDFYDITNAINYNTLISTNGNIYNYASGKSVLLAKYNLYVGQTCTSSSSCTPISTSATGYGLQSADAKGYVDSSTPRVGVVPFSGSSTNNGYWYDTSTSALKTQYGTYTNYANNIYDTNYITVPNYSVAFKKNAGNSNYSIAYYVEEYVNKLGIDGTGRLLTYTEANAMTTAQGTNGARYWLGSAYNYFTVWGVFSGGGIGGDTFERDVNYGVRPVIIVSTFDIGA